jgi:hypothetical protein
MYMMEQPPRRPMARPSFWDLLLERGSYVDTYHKRKTPIFEQAKLEKRRIRKDFKNQENKYLRKLEKDDREVYQQFGIRPSKRANKKGLDERAQAKLRHEARRKIKLKINQERRAAEKVIEVRREEQRREMRDQLRGEVYNIAA